MVHTVRRQDCLRYQRNYAGHFHPDLNRSKTREIRITRGTVVRRAKENRFWVIGTVRYWSHARRLRFVVTILDVSA